jgi:two-component system chemotaxis response regulator CheY
MRFLIAEDEFLARRILQRFLEPYGTVEIAADGEEAFEAVKASLETQQPYDLICLDVLMPKRDGQATLTRIRELEAARGVPHGKGAKIIMATGLSDSATVLTAFREHCDGFLVKPIEHAKLLALMQQFGLVPAVRDASALLANF